MFICTTWKRRFDKKLLRFGQNLIEGMLKLFLNSLIPGGNKKVTHT